MSASEKTTTTVRETIPTHLLSRIENEWQQMRAVNTPAPKVEIRPASTAQASSKA